MRGFTLLEVLVVMLVIGVLVSFAMLSLRQGDNRLEEEAQRLAELIKLAAEEAIFEGREHAVEFSDEGYTFLAFDGEKWQPLPDEPILRPRTLPDDASLSVDVEGDYVTLGADPDEEDQDERATPSRIYLLSSGEVTPFHITLRRTGEVGGFRISGDPRGRLSFEDTRRE